MKLIFLSDLHLTLPGELLFGFDPYARLACAMDKINSAYSDADMVVLLGDLTDRGRTAAFEALRDALSKLTLPVAMTLGNHDNREVFTRVFDHADLDENGFAQSSHVIGDHRLILLDTLERASSPSGGWGRSEGVLCERRLEWLGSQLDERPTIIAMHHPAIHFGHEMDAYSLANPDRLLNAISDADVRLKHRAFKLIHILRHRSSSSIPAV
ncbi:MAG: metallophosphoesterase [Pseudomonadota bacterium]